MRSRLQPHCNRHTIGGTFRQWLKFESGSVSNSNVETQTVRSSANRSTERIPFKHKTTPLVQGVLFDGGPNCSMFELRREAAAITEAEATPAQAPSKTEPHRPDLG